MHLHAKTVCTLPAAFRFMWRVFTCAGNYASSPHTTPHGPVRPHLASVVLVMPGQDDVLLCHVSIIQRLEGQRGLTRLGGGAHLRARYQGNT